MVIKMELKDKCTILVNTCDAYSDVWDLFFESIKVQWEDCPFDFVINTESKTYNHKDFNIKISNYMCEKGDKWGKRYKEALKAIKTPYVIPILEDFVLTKPVVKKDYFEKIIQWMDNDTDIAVFYLYKHPYVINEKTKYEGFGQMPQKCDYKLTTAIGLWRKDTLYSYLKDFESPWEWEGYASIRASFFYKEKMYALLDNQKDIFVFPFGGVIWRGRWYTETPQIAENYGIHIDFDTRGMMDESDPFNLRGVYSLRTGFPRDIFKKVFWNRLCTLIVKRFRIIRCIIGV